MGGLRFRSSSPDEKGAENRSKSASATKLDRSINKIDEETSPNSDSGMSRKPSSTRPAADEDRRPNIQRSQTQKARMVATNPPPSIRRAQTQMSSSSRPEGPQRNSSVRSTQQRPSIPQRSSTMHSEYVEMLLSQDEIPRMHNIFAAVFVWLLLAGFLVFPGTFTSIEESILDNDDISDDTAGAILDTVRNVPLVIVGGVVCGIAAIGMIWLLSIHRRNYVWLLNRLYLPGVANSLAGLISTLINVYGSQNGTWSIMAKVTFCVEGGCLLVIGGFLVFTQLYLLRGVRKKHGIFYQNGPFGNEGGNESAEKLEQNRRKPEPESTSAA